MTDKTELAQIPKGMEGMITYDRPTGADGGVLGNEGIGRDDILMPRLGLAQKMSPEIDPTSPKRIEGLEFTDLFNSLSRMVYGKGPLHFVILRRDNPRWVEFNPIDQGGGIKDMNVPPGDPRTKFTTGPDGQRVKPVATMFYDFIVLLLNDFDPSAPLENVVALSLKSSAIKAAKHLNFLVQQRGRKLICKGVYAIYKIRNAGWLTADSPLEKMVVEMFEAWKDRRVTVDTEGPTREPGADDFDPNTLEGQTTDM